MTKFNASRSCSRCCASWRIARGRPHGSERTVEVPETQVYTVHDGKIVEVREYRTKSEALQAVGLAG